MGRRPRRREAERLEGRGYDTYVRGSVAFSTLGWLDDPVLSNWMQSSRVELAELVLHELLHRTTYLAGQTDFNESYANFVGHRGAIAYFEEVDGPEAATTIEARKHWQAQVASSGRLGSALERLRALYAQAESDGRAEADVLRDRRAIFAELGDPDKVNNAVLLSRMAYLDRLAWFDEVGRRWGDARRSPGSHGRRWANSLGCRPRRRPWPRRRPRPRADRAAREGSFRQGQVDNLPVPNEVLHVRVLFYYRGIENLGVGYLMSMLKAHGHEIDLIFDPGLDDNLFIKMPHLAWMNRHEALLERGIGIRFDGVRAGLRRIGPARVSSVRDQLS